MHDEQSGPEFLYAPWRMEYVGKTERKPGGCIFCEKPQDTDDCANCLVYRGETCFIIMNAYPYNSGHLMIIPYQHTADLMELPAATQAEMMRLTTLAVTALRHAMAPDGFNIGMNLGRAGGAGIAEHLHLHIVPRWHGDTNFITVVGNTRVVPEAIPTTWKKITRAFAEITRDGSPAAE